ncbi:phosphotransferase enzyme family protein [Microbacterium sp.]|uniref:phosphotransferase enzyme family protein n=1 Tax=Microbacterium sp. TaxID=51671 RepID=UPI0039E3F66D
MDASIARAERIARSALPDFDLATGATLTFVKHRENTVFRVECAQGRFALRIARPGYRTDAEIESEIAYVRALRAHGIDAPDYRAVRGGGSFVVREVDGLRFPVVVQRWLDDGAPLEDIANAVDGTSSLTPEDFAALGGLAAHMHEAAGVIGLPPGYDRPAWDAEGLVGRGALWGDPGGLAEHSDDDLRVLRAAAASLTRVLTDAGTDAEVYGVLHADFTPENVMRRADGSLTLIDFDDFGEGWHAFDLATTLFFFQFHPRYLEYRAALEDGYTRARRVPERTLALLDALILARGMTYLGWAAARRGDDTAEFLVADVRPFVLELARRHLSA